ncbi:MAG: ribonuclease P protein component [Candidatus Magasanikbacteria bacterium RIFCSPHIGHO2_01_FULL_41_23]|uniref:Ribonuclease P protein component n=1 Tax=Candidatus Magasanikbacteria bacterium RIFCSPLOWO2_01_FULL_40_15 TaxID=1798686 RepID=A0A1F6N320_9BACT|nr:MAG: ribonuclease P protein component [Candidatus Magasanikbacteria bacterium RIFCSPHIGHO2_01_FULL_41_23]OGH76439.1 MAG: ribonuclease P protein component [Candidatus Magasanikbacteria bacterium RIFCSPHIGHO2_12_FULL_41_16]OGH78396.1 MAG: ribonuclease P protein component [Candidatus Magasanikbacteria bacterium RIFCSPLOWO2_01_FULL_40_15]
MLPRENRLTKMKDYEILFKEGIFCGASLITAKIWKIQPEKYSRRKYTLEDLKIGFLVSKKVSKRAVDRNRLKRQMREVIRLLLKDKRIDSGYMIAFSAKNNSLDAEYKNIEDNINHLLHRAHCLV